MHVTPDRMYVLGVGVAEVFSILVRKQNGKQLTPAAFAQALIDFDAEIIRQTRLRKIIADTDPITSALSLIARHSINATDAILLRSALDLDANLRVGGDSLALVASDQRLLRAAQAEGLTTFNPETQTTADLDALLV